MLRIMRDEVQSLREERMSHDGPVYYTRGYYRGSLPGGSIPIAHCERASVPTIEGDVSGSCGPEKLCIDTCIVRAAQVFAYDAF